MEELSLCYEGDYIDFIDSKIAKEQYGYDCKEFHEYQLRIQKDFEIFRDYYLVKYQNSEKLQKEIEKIINNVTNTFFFGSEIDTDAHTGYYKLRIIYYDDYVVFNYFTEKPYQYHTVFLKRDYKEFYFYDGFNLTLQNKYKDIRKYKLEDNQVVENNFQTKNELNWYSKDTALESVKKLKNKMN